MKLNRLLIVATFSGLAFVSCKNNEREIDEVNRVEIEDDRDEDMRTSQQGMNDENSITARVQRNQNLSTFNEGLTRNQISNDLNMRASTQTSTTATGTAQTGTAQTGTTQTGTTQTGTTQTGTNAGQINNQGMNSGQVSYTIFAPTNDAYSSLSQTQRDEWNSTQNRDKNVASINYLMVNHRITQEQLKQQIQSSNGAYTIKTMQGENLTATMDGNNIVLRDAAGNQAKIIESDVEGTNGVIHVIDKVLRPKDATRNDAKTVSNTGTTKTGSTNNQ